MQVFPLRHLECFYEDEIERLLCGEGEAWCGVSAVPTALCDCSRPALLPIDMFGAQQQLKLHMELHMEQRTVHQIRLDVTQHMSSWIK